MISGFHVLYVVKSSIEVRLSTEAWCSMSWALRSLTEKQRQTFHRLFTEVREKGKQSCFMLPECDYLRSIAMPRLHVSTVVDAKTGKGIKSDVRTSSGMFLSPDERKYPMIQAIEKRIDVYSQIPAENGELIQVLRNVCSFSCKFWVDGLLTEREKLLK
ncbi:hypothetical protein RND71_025159 [Anisodus tanguticus]|uniref:Uncharacterized protein n=1 Tax=Anisodus tanguticus TaxID=243964 RepID=A0AAE1RQW3_9SOLA|nr:hypothetical protein RND71_025159 [Anisodus tanguticus]